MYKYIFFLFLINHSNCFSQKKEIYIKIPTHLKVGTIIYDLHPDNSDSVFTITFSDLPNKKDDAAFMLICNRINEKVDANRIAGKNILTPIQIMDSLKATGRSFFRDNKFYILYEKGFNNYIHKAKGEYIYMSYKNEDSNN